MQQRLYIITGRCGNLGAPPNRHTISNCNKHSFGVFGVVNFGGIGPILIATNLSRNDSNSGQLGDDFKALDYSSPKQPKLDWQVMSTAKDLLAKSDAIRCEQQEAHERKDTN